MPSPLRREGIGYTKWEVLQNEEQNSNSLEEVPYHTFEEDTTFSNNNNSKAWSTNFKRQSASQVIKIELPHNVWHCSIKGIYFLIIFGLGWIFGFLVRWGVHKYYIEPLGHCETPSNYRYSPELAKEAMDWVDFNSIQAYYDDFIKFNHDPGSTESYEYVDNLSAEWKHIGIQKVEVDSVNIQIPVNTAIKSEIIVKDPQQNIVFRQDFDSQVAYSASAIGRGNLVYGHFGRFEDFQSLDEVDFKNSTVLLRVSPMFHVGSMVRNAQHFGAKAIILFPDPFYYKISSRLSDSDKTAIKLQAKYFPGEPQSPYAQFPVNFTIPSIPVISIDFKTARNLLVEYTDLTGVNGHYLHGLDIKTPELKRNFTASVEVEVSFKKSKLNNLVGAIPGKYEPTRYVIIGSHHDTWAPDHGKPGLAHSVLMELARIFGMLFSQHHWKPGRSIIFVSWDGNELGQLGSMSWLRQHSKELASRAVAFINLDYELKGQKGPVAASALFRRIVELAAKSVDVDDNDTLHDIWIKEEQMFNLLPNNGTIDQPLKVPKSVSVSQNIFGISSLDVPIKKVVTWQGTKIDKQASLATAAKNVLNNQFQYATFVTKFVIILIMQLSTSPDIPLQANEYAQSIHRDLHEFLRANQKPLSNHHVDIRGIMEATQNFEIASERFHNTYSNQSARLEMLGHHEFSDQILELEKSFLAPLHLRDQPDLLYSPYLHVLYGPSILNAHKSTFLPKLSDALTLAVNSGTVRGSDQLWNQVNKEVFRINAALDSATRVLDNQLVYTYVKHF